MHRSENSSKVVCSTIPTGDGRDSKSKPDNQQPMNQDKVSTIGPTVTETPPGKLASGGFQEAAKEATSAAQTEFEKLRGAAREQGSAAVKEIKTVAESTAREAQQAGSDFIHEQKGNLAQKVQNYAEAVRGASKRLREEEGNILAEPAEKTAEQLERMSTYLRDKEPADLLEDLESFTRRRPEVVFGSLFFIGLAAARFFKASSRRASAAGSPRSLGKDVGSPDFAQTKESLPPPQNFPAGVTTPSPASTTSPTV